MNIPQGVFFNPFSCAEIAVQYFQHSEQKQGIHLFDGDQCP